MNKIPILIIIFFLVSGLTLNSAQAIELTIVNDIKKYEQNRILKIENAISVEAPKTKINFKINPGEEKAITKGNVRSFVISRAFSRHKIKYDILCPKDIKGKHQVNLVQIHNNKIPGGCKLARTGHRAKIGGMSWEIVDKEAWKELEAERVGLKIKLGR